GSMMSEVDRIREILSYDINPDFLRDVGIATVWEYRHLYEVIRDDYLIPLELKEEYFVKRRSDCAIKALVSAARRHGIPFEFRRLESNGQQKIILKLGRVILIQETFSSLRDGPRASDYKRNLANTHGLIRQLELDLGDQPHRILDWSGS